VPDFQKIKFNYWGHDAVVFHEHGIRKSGGNEDYTQKEYYKILLNEKIRNAFLQDLSHFIKSSSFQVISMVVDKRKYISKTQNPYELALHACMLGLNRFFVQNNQTDENVSIIFESRGKTEDSDLKTEFKNICNHFKQKDKTMYVSDMNFEMLFVKKSANCTGIQIADLIARPIGLNYLRPEQKNQAFEIIKEKINFLILGQGKQKDIEKNQCPDADR